MDREVVHIVGQMRSNCLRLGRLIQEISDTQAFVPLGFPNMNAWMNSNRPLAH
jgi:hypothetical protein